MSEITPAEIRDYLAGLELANEFEIQELRRSSTEIKLRQLWVLMSAARLFQDDATREADIRSVRERWDRLHRALCA